MSDTRGPEYEPEEGVPAAPKETQDFFVETEPGAAIGEEVERPRARLLPMWILLAAVILVGVFWAISDRYFSTGGEGNDSVPLVVADDTPVKVRPDEPGGVDVPDRDKYVYRSLTEEDAVETEAESEQLAPPPEEPMQRPPVEVTEIEAPDKNIAEVLVEIVPGEAVENFAEFINETPDAPQQADQEDMMADVNSDPESVSGTVADFASNTTREAVQVAQDGTPEAVTSQPEQLLAPLAEAKEVEIIEAVSDVPAMKSVEEVAEEWESAPEQAPEPEVKASEPTPEPKAAVSASNPAFMLQIGASQNEKAASESLAHLAKTYPKILGLLDAVVVRADLGNKGVWYRMRVGPFAARSVAGTVCEQLKAVDVGCFVVAN